MPKIAMTCIRCGQGFSVWPSRLKWQEARGTEVKFCSQACTAAARSEGLIASRKREGEEVPCATCGKLVYMKQFKLKTNTLHFCSQKCRTKAISENRVDRKFEQASEKKRTGKSFACRICGEKKYQRISYYNRNVNKTCGKSECVSAYARSRWGLPPCSANHRRRSAARGKLPQPKRASNFTAKQKAEWLACECARCGATENLALDHILAVCAGGLSTRDNAQTLCQPCNNWKSRHVDMPLARAKNKLRKAA